MKKYFTPVFVVLIFIFGFIFRLWLINYSPQPIVYDQLEYHRFAAAWYANGIAAYWFRTYAYPLFLLLVYKLAGLGNLSAVFWTQAFLDTATGLLLFFITEKIFPAKKFLSHLALSLYVFNPYTSAYVGVLLTEVLAAFLLGLFFLISLLLLQTRHKIKQLIAIFLATLTASYLAQVRPAFFLWSFIASALLVYFLHQNLPNIGHKVKYSVIIGLVALTGYILPAGYSIYLNYRFYHQFSPTSVVGLWQEIYTGTFIKGYPAFIYKTSDYSPQLPAIYQELYQYGAQGNPAQRAQLDRSFITRALKTIAADPADYAQWRVRKMFHLWDREKLFFYSEKNYQFHWQYFLWLNRFLVICAIVGIIKCFRQPSGSSLKQFFLLATITLIISTLLFSLTHAESRLTIPLVPLIIFFAATIIYSGGGWALKQLAKLQVN